MSGLLDNISDFFVNLFSKDPNAARLRKQLRELQETVLSVKPQVYSKSSQEVLPGFAQSWMKFYQLILPIYDLLSKTIGSPDRKIQTLSMQFVIESLLVGDITERRVALNMENIKSRLASAPSAEAEVSNMTNEFNSLIGDIKRQDNDLLNGELVELVRLKNLVTFSFQPFFKKFGYDLSMLGKQNPRFNAADADSVLPELLDLYFLLAGFEVSPSLEKGLGALLERVSPAKAAENQKKMGKILDKIRDLMRGPCSPHLVRSLIKILRLEPEFEPEAQKIKESYFQTYADGLTERFTQDRDKAQRERNESTLEADVKALFPNTQLLSLDNYTTITSEELEAAGMTGLTMVRAMQIMRSFCFSVLKAAYLDSVKQVVLNGFFQDKEWATQLSNSLYAAEAITTRLEAFDHNLIEEGKTNLPALEKYLSGKVPVSGAANQIVDKINRSASEVLEEEVGVVAMLSIRVQEILMDYKSPQPEHVTNIKGLGGKNHRDILEGLVNGYNKSMQLMRIMKHFVVVKGLKLK